MDPPAAPPSFSHHAGRIGRYTITGELGHGGMGVVYRAEDERLGRSVALKLLPPHLSQDARATDRLLAEARAAAALDHPNVCTVYEVAETDDGRPYIAFACYDGQTLRDRLRDGAMSVDEAVRVGREIASGLAAAHARGIVHRDLKPSNVFLCDDGTAKILDFGIAKVRDETLTEPGEVPGTIEYGAPETAQGIVDERSDVWSLGVVLYEMLTGRRPFGGGYHSAVLYAVLHEAARPPSEAKPSVPEAVDAVVMRCLAKDPDARYPDAASVAVALAPPEAARAEDVGVTLRRLGRVMLRRFRRSRAWQGGLVGALLVAVGTTVWVARSDDGGAGPSMPSTIHLAVLPPAPRPDSPDDFAFSHGLAETLASGVTELGAGGEGFWVAPVSEVLSLGVTSAREAGDRLGVNVAVTGGLQRAGGQTTLTLNLTTTGARPRTLDSRTLTFGVDEEARIRGRALLAIAEMLGLEVSDVDGARLASGTVDPEAERFYLAGVGYLERNQEANDLARAVDLFEQAIAEDAQFAQAHARLGEALLATYEVTRDSSYVRRAEASAEAAEDLDPSDPFVYVTLSKLALTTGRYPLAMRHARRALEIDPASLAGALALAAAQEASADVEGAEQTLRTLVQRSPDAWTGPLHLGKFLFRQNRFDEAARQFERVTTLVPGNFQGHLALGGSRQMLGDDAGAISAYEETVRLRPDHYATYSNLGTLLLYAGLDEEEAGRPEAAAERFQEAAQRYRQAVDLDSSRHVAWRNLASAYSETGEEGLRLDALRHALRRADADLAVNPDDARTLANVGTYRQQLGDRSGAFAAATRAAQLAPADPDVLYEAAMTLVGLGEHDDALDALEAAAEAGHALAYIEGDSVFEPLESAPRYQQLLARRSSP